MHLRNSFGLATFQTEIDRIIDNLHGRLQFARYYGCDEDMRREDVKYAMGKIQGMLTLLELMVMKDREWVEEWSVAQEAARKALTHLQTHAIPRH